MYLFPRARANGNPFGCTFLVSRHHTIVSAVHIYFFTILPIGDISSEKSIGPIDIERVDEARWQVARDEDLIGLDYLPYSKYYPE